MNTLAPAFLSIVGLFATSLATQSQPGNAQDPFERGPLVRIATSGPDAIRQALLPTNLGALLSSPEAGTLWTTSHGWLRMVLTGAAGGNEDFAAALEERLAKYGGRIDAALRVHMGDTGPTGVSGFLALWNDGTTDLDAIAASIRRLADPDRLRQVTVNDELTVDVLDSPEDVSLTLPTRFAEQHLALVFSTDIARELPRQVAHLERLDAARTQERGPHTELFHVDLDLLQIREMVAVENRRGGFGDIADRVFGMRSWDRAILSARTAGPRVEVGVRLDYPLEDRGIFGALLPAAGTLPDTVRWIPNDDSLAYMAGHFDWAAMWDVVIEVGRAFSGMFGGPVKSADELKAEANDEVGFDIEEELLDLITTEFLWLVRPKASEDEPSVMEADGICFAQRVANSQRLTPTYAKLVRWDELNPGEQHEVHGHTVAEVRVFDGNEHLSLTDDLLVVGAGDRGLETMRELLGHQPSAEAAIPKGLRTVRRSAPPGCNLVGSLPVSLMRESLFFTIVWEIWSEVRREIPGGRGVGRQDLRELIEFLAPLLERHELERVALFGGFEREGNRGTSRLRLVW